MRNSITNTLPTLALACATLFATSCAEVEADVPEAQVTQKAVTFQGTGWSNGHGEASTMQFFTLSSTNLAWMKDLNSKVYVTEIDLAAVAGVQDLNFIHYAHVSISDASAKVPPVEIATYMRPDNMAPTAVLKVKTAYPIDISKVWTAKKMLVGVAVAGDLPEKSWSVDVTLHLSGKISYKL